MRVFVLGAGASKHAGYPLTYELGEQLWDWAQRDDVEGARVRDDLAEVRKRYGSLLNLETIVTDLQEVAVAKNQQIPQLGQAISFFFNSIREHPAPLYDALAKLVSPGDVVVTFNYDLAIERSLKSAGLWEIGNGYGDAFDLGNDVAPNGRVQVLKLHGSTNWWGVFALPRGYGAAQDLTGAPPVLFFHPDAEFLGYKDFRDPRAPAVAGIFSPLILPSLEKQFFLKTSSGEKWRSFWDSLWVEAENAVQSADEVVFIGYSLPGADRRARDLLLRRTNHRARIVICSRGHSESIAQEFVAGDFNCVFVPEVPTFEAWLAAPEKVRPLPCMTQEEWEQDFEAWADSFPQTPVLTPETLRRESLYDSDE